MAYLLRFCFILRWVKLPCLLCVVGYCPLAIAKFLCLVLGFTGPLCRRHPEYSVKRGKNAPGLDGRARSGCRRSWMLGERSLVGTLAYSRIMSWRSEKLHSQPYKELASTASLNIVSASSFFIDASTFISLPVFLIAMSITPIITFKAGACDFDVSDLNRLMSYLSGSFLSCW